MKLVIRYTAGDRYTCSFINHVPVEAESPKAAIVEFSDSIEKAMKARVSFFVFNKRQFQVSHFFEDGKVHSPDFLTIDEWFGTIPK